MHYFTSEETPSNTEDNAVSLYKSTRRIASFEASTKIEASIFKNNGIVFLLQILNRCGHLQLTLIREASTRRWRRWDCLRKMSTSNYNTVLPCQRLLSIPQYSIHLFLGGLPLPTSHNTPYTCYHTTQGLPYKETQSALGLAQLCSKCCLLGYSLMLMFLPISLSILTH